MYKGFIIKNGKMNKKNQGKLPKIYDKLLEDSLIID